MRPWKLIVASATIAVLSVTAWNTVNAQAPGPTSGEAITTGLLSPRGMKIGPDGMLYVAEAGEGGATTITVDGAEHHVGNSGRISKIDPETGERTTVADGLHSDFSTATMDSVGPADVAFLGGNLYYVQTHGGEAYGAADTPTGVYRINNDGSTALIADIGQFNFDNPVSDIGPGGGQGLGDQRRRLVGPREARPTNELEVVEPRVGNRVNAHDRHGVPFGHPVLRERSRQVCGRADVRRVELVEQRQAHSGRRRLFASPAGAPLTPGRRPAGWLPVPLTGAGHVPSSRASRSAASACCSAISA